MELREQQELLEEKLLSPLAQRSAQTRGRAIPLERCTLRTDFQRDRDRIIHCKAFRRLKYKTQVFLLPDGDHYRTRLTHTLEVAQIARTISRALRLNEDLTEAICLGHDLGHTPFGHVGESVLNKMLPGGFEHNAESLRVVEKLENNGVGLNLTWEVRDGILHHKKSGAPATLEGKVVSYADRIAYLNHDIDDAIRGQILKDSDLPEDCVRVLGSTHGKRINMMILDVVGMSMDAPVIRMSDECDYYMNKLRDFMFERVYTDPLAKKEEGKAMHVVEALYKHFKEHVGEMSEEFVRVAHAEGKDIGAADYIACMTDRYAIDMYTKLFVPFCWGIK